MIFSIQFTVLATMEKEFDNEEEARDFAEHIGDIDHPWEIQQVINVYADSEVEEVK